MKLSMNRRELDLSSPRVMGIINLTPDSFYDGGKHVSEANILRTCEHMLLDGADIIDIGGVSTRPGALEVNQEEEIKRVLPMLKQLVVHFPDTWFSIDTFRSDMAQRCIDAGAMIINDISGGNMDPLMFKTVAKLKVPYILMHMHGIPQMMQKNPLGNSVVSEVKQFFEHKVNELHALGCDQIILDPGFGFGKTLEANYLLLNKLESVRIKDLPVLAGVSRKSMINKVLELTPNEAIAGTTVLNTIALLQGANMLRVHDVKEAVQAVKLVKQYQKVTP